MSNFTKEVDEKAIKEYILTFFGIKGYEDIKDDLRKMDLPNLLDLARLFEIKQPSGNILELQNLDNRFLKDT